MAMQPVTQVVGRAVLVAGDDIDTDRIIPARYLKCVTFDDLGDALFFDERFAEDLDFGQSDQPRRRGRPRKHPR